MRESFATETWSLLCESLIETERPRTLPSCGYDSHVSSTKEKA